jgi:hypothetical protein
MVESLNTTHADLVQKSPLQENLVVELTTVRQSDHHPAFLELGNLKVNQVDIKEGFLKIPLNQNAFATKFLPPNDYNKSNLENVVNKITSLTDAQRKQLLAVLIKNDRDFQGIWGEYIREPIELKLKLYATPVWNKPYPTPLKHRAALEIELQCQCDIGPMRRLNPEEVKRQDWCFPGFGVPQKNGQIRFVIIFGRENR